ncbi:MAG: rRNA pseudouridine synthase [Clostridiales bacterium]|nr:rRNA pseudouridine synthase [Candidatus Crickella caballi]
MKMRLDRYLAECGYGTRSEVKSLIKKGKVSVNGSVVTDGGCKVELGGNPGKPEAALSDAVTVDGRTLTYEQFRYFMLNKPAGCVSATRDGLSRTVLDILEAENTRDLFPVGRLDKDTEGLLLITNDGQLAHRLLSPKKHVDKTYIAYVRKPLNDDELVRFMEGLDIGDDEPTLPAKIRRVDDGDDCFGGATYEVIIHEGRYHQIKRMFEALDNEVQHLRRVAMGSLILDDELAPGEYRRLSEQEVAALTEQ